MSLSVKVLLGCLVSKQSFLLLAELFSAVDIVVARSCCALNSTVLVKSQNLHFYDQHPAFWVPGMHLFWFLPNPELTDMMWLWNVLRTSRMQNSVGICLQALSVEHDCFCNVNG